MYPNDNDLDSELDKITSLVASRPEKEPDFEDQAIEEKIKKLSSEIGKQRAIKQVNLKYLVNSAVGLRNASDERVLESVSRVDFKEDSSTDWMPDYEVITHRTPHYEEAFADNLSSGRLDSYNPVFMLDTDRECMTVAYEDIGYELKLSQGQSKHPDVMKIMEANRVDEDLVKKIEALTGEEHKKKTIINGIISSFNDDERAFICDHQSQVSDLYQSFNLRSELYTALAESQAVSLYSEAQTDDHRMAVAKIALSLRENLVTEEKRDNLFKMIVEHRRSAYQRNKVDFEEIDREWEADIEALRYMANISDGDVVDLSMLKRAKAANGFAVSYVKLEQQEKELEELEEKEALPPPSNVTQLFKPK